MLFGQGFRVYGRLGAIQDNVHFRCSLVKGLGFVAALEPSRTMSIFDALGIVKSGCDSSKREFVQEFEWRWGLLRFMLHDLGFRVYGLWFRVWGLGI